MAAGDAVDVQEARGDQRAGARLGGRGALAQQFHLQPALFLSLAQGGRLGVLVQLDVAAQREPLVQVTVVDEQDLARVDDKDRHGEINLLVDVSHTLLWGQGGQASIGKPPGGGGGCPSTCPSEQTAGADG